MGVEDREVLLHGVSKKDMVEVVTALQQYGKLTGEPQHKGGFISAQYDTEAAASAAVEALSGTRFSSSLLPVYVRLASTPAKNVKRKKAVKREAEGNDVQPAKVAKVAAVPTFQPKMELHKFTMQHQLPAPQYIVHPVIDAGAKYPKYQGSVTVSGATHVTSPMPSKKEAEREAAKLALEALGCYIPPHAFEGGDPWVHRNTPQRSAATLRNFVKSCGFPPGEVVWIFTAGDDMWLMERVLKVRGEAAHIKGYGRQFCLWDNTSWGTSSLYGLQCGLIVSKGLCHGVAFPVPPALLDKAAEVGLPTEGTNPIYTEITLPTGKVQGVAFAANLASPQFTNLSPSDQGNVISGACGPAGPNFELPILLKHTLEQQGKCDPAVSNVISDVIGRLWPEEPLRV